MRYLRWMAILVVGILGGPLLGRISSTFESPFGFSNVTAEFALKKPPRWFRAS